MSQESVFGGIAAVMAVVAIAAAVASTPAATEPISAQTSEVTGSDARAILDSVGAENVGIVWSSDPVTNCGAAASTDGLGGCFHSSQPDAITLSPGLAGAELTYIVLHEYAHVTQHRQGLPLDECEADDLAITWGANPTLAHYAPLC